MSEKSVTPSIGRIVHVRIGGDDTAPTLRPAMVTNSFDGGHVNVTIFLDHANDNHGWGEVKQTLLDMGIRKVDALHAAGSSLHEGSAVGEWRWPGRS